MTRCPRCQAPRETASEPCPSCLLATDDAPLLAGRYRLDEEIGEGAWASYSRPSTSGSSGWWPRKSRRDLPFHQGERPGDSASGIRAESRPAAVDDPRRGSLERRAVAPAPRRPAVPRHGLRALGLPALGDTTSHRTGRSRPPRHDSGSGSRQRHGRLDSEVRNRRLAHRSPVHGRRRRAPRGVADSERTPSDRCRHPPPGESLALWTGPHQRQPLGPARPRHRSGGTGSSGQIHAHRWRPRGTGASRSPLDGGFGEPASPSEPIQKHVVMGGRRPDGHTPLDRTDPLHSKLASLRDRISGDFCNSRPEIRY